MGFHNYCFHIHMAFLIQHQEISLIFSLNFWKGEYTTQSLGRIMAKYGQKCHLLIITFFFQIRFKNALSNHVFILFTLYYAFYDTL